MKIIRTHYGALWATALAFASLASANIQINFDSASNPFSEGTISSDQSVSGSSSLLVGADELPIYSLPAEYQNKNITISMQVFDQGKWVTAGNAYGPRWGVGSSYDSTNYTAAALINKSFFGSNNGYAYHNTIHGDSFNGSFSSNTWNSPSFVPGSSRTGLSATGDGSAGDGVWTEWVFNVSSTGEISWGMTSLTAIQDNIGAAATSIYLFGGDTNSNLVGIYIDDVTISLTAVPEPSTYAFILGLAGFALITIQRRIKHVES